MKSDTSVMLYNSHFSRYFSFSVKNDPFLVYPSIKNNSSSGLAQGGGATSLKKIRGATGGTGGN
jgi:hypothetical protein